MKLNWKWVHRWLSDNLVEPFFQAEMHRVKMHLKELPDLKKKGKLRLVEGKKQNHYYDNAENKKIRNVL